MKTISKNKRYLQLASVALAVCLIFPAVSLASEPSGTGSQSWLLGIIFKLERMKDREIAEIRKYDAEIQKCNATIRASEGIISKARAKGNTEAEQIAHKALRTAQEAKRKNEELRSLAEIRKRRAETAHDSVYNRLSKEVGRKEEIHSVVTNYTGRVEINRPGETIPLDGTRAGYLEPGDTIRTFENSSAEMQFLDGRGSLKVGPDSQFKMKEDNSGAQIIDMLKGKMHIAVEKMDEYQKKMEESIRAYREDAQTVKDAGIELVQAYDRFLKELRARARKKLDVRTNTMVMTVRGTEFLVFEDEKKGTELIVLEGSVEIKNTKGEETIIVNAGHKATATRDGVLSSPQKIDLTSMNKWWEE